MIIGYTAVKKELQQIADTLRNRDVYDKLGISAPRGLLLYGEPGVGKSLMASAIIEASGRSALVCRKDKPNGDFVKEIKATFDKAIAEAPSIVYLDDMDKFANGDERHPDVPFPKKQTQKKLRKPNEAKEINQPAQSGKQNAREPATPKQSGDANDYKKPQCTQKCRPEPELGKQNAAGE